MTGCRLWWRCGCGCGCGGQGRLATAAAAAVEETLIQHSLIMTGGLEPSCPRFNPRGRTACGGGSGRAWRRPGRRVVLSVNYPSQQTHTTRHDTQHGGEARPLSLSLSLSIYKLTGLNAKHKTWINIRRARPPYPSLQPSLAVLLRTCALPHTYTASHSQSRVRIWRPRARACTCHNTQPDFCTSSFTSAQHNISNHTAEGHPVQHTSSV